MRVLFVTLLTAVLISACDGAGPANGSADPAAQRNIVAKACSQGKLKDFGLGFNEEAKCVCAASEIQKQLSPEAMSALELYARGKEQQFKNAVAALPSDERIFLETERTNKTLDNTLLGVAVDCIR